MIDGSQAEMLQAADQIKVAVRDLFSIGDTTLGLPDQPQTIRLRGRLMLPSDQAYPKLEERFRHLGYTAMLRRDPENGLDVILAVPGVVPRGSGVTRPWINIGLYILTILSTLFVGATWSDQVPASADLGWILTHLWVGWPFALSLMAILTAHELGHFFAGRYYKVPVSLPYFVPFPVPPLGTMGAVIAMKGPTINRRQMLTVGAAGPLAGFVVAVPILLLGLSLSTVQPMSPPEPGMVVFLEGQSLLYVLLKLALFGQILPGSGAPPSFLAALGEAGAALFGSFPLDAGYDVFVHPVALAGWAGLLITGLNLIPVGQLDGGHVLYSLVGQRARALTWPIIGLLVLLGIFFWQGWLLWAVLIFFFGQAHPDPLDDVTRLDMPRKVVAVVVLVIFVLTFTPLPMQLVPGEDLPVDPGDAAQLLLVPGLVAGTVLGLVRWRNSGKEDGGPSILSSKSSGGGRRVWRSRLRRVAFPMSVGKEHNVKKMTRVGLLLVVLVLTVALLPLASLSAPEPEAARAGDVFVHMPASAYRAADLRPVRAEDYGTFVWLELTQAEADRLRASGLAFQTYAEPFTLRLGELRFDTRQGDPVLPAGWEGIRGDGPDLHLVQFAGPTRAEWLDSLRAAGLEVVQYIHPFTYVVWGEPGALSRTASAGFVQWTGPFAPAYRVLPRWQALADEPVRVSVLLIRAANTDAAIGGLEALGGQFEGRAVLNHVYERAIFTLSGARLQEAAHVPGVYSIQPRPTDGGLRGEMSNQINANNHDGTNLAYPGYVAWLADAGVDGSGVVMANVDGGIQDTHPDLVNRMLACSGTTCGGTAIDNHGTHTAGIMAADGSSGVTDSYGFLRGLGMAPGANLVEQVYLPYFTWVDGMLLLIGDSYSNGAVLSSNSWGPSGSPLGYDDDTMQVDIGVRDADSGTAGNQAFSYILSIMNGNGGTSSQGTPDEAKNIFTIGSTKMQNGDGSQILAINDLSANSAHGPALDGRKIPHMVAPGCYVDSTRTGNMHTLMCGTSMSSPHVSGAVALFFQYYRNLNGLDPSPALVKAAFLPVAHDLAGHLDADGGVLAHPFDSKQGWGRMDADAVISPTLPVLYFDDPAVLDNTGEEWVEALGAADPSQPVRLMLVWTDAPGHGLGGSTPAWNNDLDLVVEVGGDTYKGNNFAADGWSQTGGSADGMHNTEGVFLGAGSADSFTVRVQASNINSDGIPGQGDDTDQDFALVCYNCSRGEDFTLAADPDNVSVCAPDVVTATIQVGQILGYSHEVTLSVLDVPLGVTAQVSPAVVDPPGEAVLSLDAGVDAVEGQYTVVISGTGEVTRVHTVDVGLSVGLAPEASWLSDSPVSQGRPMHFTATVTGTGPFDYAWDFGGAGMGADPASATPVFTYTHAGEYPVSLAVQGACATGMATGTVRVLPVKPPRDYSIYLPLVIRH